MPLDGVRLWFFDKKFGMFVGLIGVHLFHLLLGLFTEGDRAYQQLAPKSQLMAKLDLSGKDEGSTHINDPDGLGERAHFFWWGGRGRQKGQDARLSELYLDFTQMGLTTRMLGSNNIYQHPNVPEDSLDQ